MTGIHMAGDMHYTYMQVHNNFLAAWLRLVRLNFPNSSFLHAQFGTPLLHQSPSEVFIIPSKFLVTLER